MGFVFDQGNLNVSALTIPGAYVELMTPTGLALPGPSNAIAILGTASWGPVNQPLGPFGDIGSAQAALGQFNVNLWLNDQYDVMRAAMQALAEAQTTASLNMWLSRITDGTDLAATLTLKDTTSGTALNGITMPAKYTGIGGNTIQVLVAAAGPANTYNITFVASFGGAAISEIFLGIKGATGANSPFWANLNNAILNGNQSRGPSQLIGTPTGVSSTAKDPATGNYILTGGTDGRSGVTSANFFGSDVIGNRQGIYAMRGLPIVPAYIYCAGMTDNTKFANIQAFCLTEIVRAVLPFPASTSTSTATGLRTTLGISDKRVCYAKDWIYWTDPISGQTIFCDPVAIMIGRAASLSPQLSPLNKQVYTVVATEHPQQYPSDEIGLLNTNGIWVICNPCLGSPFFGIASASTTSLNPIEQPVEYERLKDYIGIQFATILGQFVGDPQGPFDPDDTRSACKNDIDSAMTLLYLGGLIATDEDGKPGWKSQCDMKNNTPLTIQAGYMHARLDYIPYSTVKYVVLNLGTTATFTAAQALTAAQVTG